MQMFHIHYWCSNHMMLLFIMMLFRDTQGRVNIKVSWRWNLHEAIVNMELQKVVEKRPVLFLFESYWPLLKFFQIIGCFPFAKTTKDNYIGLKPLNAVLVITLYSLSWIIVVSAVIGSTNLDRRLIVTWLVSLIPVTLGLSSTLSPICWSRTFWRTVVFTELLISLLYLLKKFELSR